MGIRNLKSTTPGSRFASRNDFAEITISIDPNLDCTTFIEENENLKNSILQKLDILGRNNSNHNKGIIIEIDENGKVIKKRVLK